MPRVAVVASHPIQYQAPWFRELAARLDLEVFFCHRQAPAGQAAAGFGTAFEWDVPLLDGYSWSWLANLAENPSADRFSGCDTPEVGEQLAAGGFDACIVHGWYLKSYVQAIRACWALGMPVLLRGDSHLKGPRGVGVRAAKYLPYRWFLRRVDGHLYVGRGNYEYLRHYGVDDSRLFFVPHFVDNAWFRVGAERARSANPRASGPVTFLFAGKLIEKKRPADFIAAVAALARAGLDVRGLVVGDGPLREQLAAQVARLDAPIEFRGFQNQSAMPACYASADCLVLPSDGRETWGLVVNEAMACGLPAVTSDRVGAGPDLISEGETGYVYPVGDVEALTAALTAMVGLWRTSAPKVREAVARRIERYSCERAVDGTLEALRRVINTHILARTVGG